MKTIFIQPGDLISDLDDADGSQDRHLHLVFPAPVCPDIEELCIILVKPYTVSFEPDSVLLPRLSSIEGQSESGEVWERLFDVIDAPVLTEIRIRGFDDIPASVFQKTSLKIIDLDSARGPVSIPDDIRNLVNLEYFKLWRAGVAYMSPELFRLPRIRDISFYRVYGYEPTPEVIAAAEAFVAGGGRLESEWDAFPSAPKQRAVPEVSPESLPPDPGQERPQKTEVAAVFVLPDTEESSEFLQGPQGGPFIVVEGKSSCCIDGAGTYVFPDKPNPALTRLLIWAKESSVLLEGSRLELPNLEEIFVSKNASLAIFADIAAKLVAPKLRKVEFRSLENVEFPQSLGLLKSLHFVSFGDCSMLDSGSFPSLDSAELYFSWSTVVGIPDGILNAHSLTSLTFLDCKIGSFDPKILIAEDNATNQKVLSLMLRKLGCRPECVSNGVECVERLKTEDFDMILMDFQMPVMDGCQAAREIRALGKSVWITGLTYNGSPDVISLCTNSGMDDCLVFPYRLHKLMQAIRKFRAARAKPTQ